MLFEEEILPWLCGFSEGTMKSFIRCKIFVYEFFQDERSMDVRDIVVGRRSYFFNKERKMLRKCVCRRKKVREERRWFME